MTFKNAKQIDCNFDDNSIFKNMDIGICYTAKPSKHELDLFYSALIIFSNYVKSHHEIISTSSVNVIFTSDGVLEQIKMDYACAGCVLRIIIYNMGVWRIIPDCTDELIMAVYLEELTHMFLGIDDEIEVKHKTYQIMHSVKQNYTFEEYAKSIGWEDELL